MDRMKDRLPSKTTAPVWSWRFFGLWFLVCAASLLLAGREMSYWLCLVGAAYASGVYYGCWYVVKRLGYRPDMHPTKSISIVGYFFGYIGTAIIAYSVSGT